MEWRPVLEVAAPVTTLSTQESGWIDNNNTSKKLKDALQSLRKIQLQYINKQTKVQNNKESN